MDLLGPFNSQLIQFASAQLLQQLQQAVAIGDYGGGQLIDSSVIASLNQQASDFSSLPGLPAGSRALVQSILNPLQLLGARYSAIASERDSFLAKMAQYLALLNKETGLIDQLVAAANVEVWAAQEGVFPYAYRVYQDFAATHGLIATYIPFTDPTTGVAYWLPGSTTEPVQDATFLLNAVPGYEAEPLRQGITVPGSLTEIEPSSLNWQVPSGLTPAENLTGPDWAKLGFLQPGPEVTFDNPVLTLIGPQAAIRQLGSTPINRLFAIQGDDNAGNISVYVQIVFQQRRMTAQIATGDSGEAIAFTNYQLVGNDFVVLDASQSYEQGIDYTVDDYSRFVPTSTTANKLLTLCFTVMFPSYQCSINQVNWSAPLMFDPAVTAGANGNWFPVTDEAGRSMGLWIQMLQVPTTNYLLRIDTSAAPGYGITATLQIEFDKTVYMDGIHLAPFATYPTYLVNISGEGLTDIPTTIYDSVALGEVVLDREMTIRFPRQLVGQLFITMRQENYEFVQQVQNPADQLRRQTLVSLQSVLPFSEQRINITPAPMESGAQYEFGLGNIRGEDWESVMPQDYGVLVSGPFEVEGTPELIRFDAQYCGNVDFYLMDQPFNVAGVAVPSAYMASNANGIQITPGVAFAYVPPSINTLQKCRFYVKFVLRDQYSVVERFLLEASTF